MAGVVSVGVHIFKRESAAVENYFIYTVLDNDFCNLQRNFKTQHEFSDRCAKHGISQFSIELSVYEKKSRKMVVLTDPKVWDHAYQLILKDEADLHGMLVCQSITLMFV